MGLREALRRRRGPVPPPAVLHPDDPTLEVCLVAADPAQADSAVLAAAAERGVDLAQPLLVRHVLVGLPDGEAVEEARRQLAQDGYAVVPGPDDAPPRAVRACRTQVLTALSASQERSRMAGLAQRLGGDVAGYDAMRPRAQA